MKKTIKRPPAFLTTFEALRFRVNYLHKIPPIHHINLVDFNGVSKSDFEKYIRLGHGLSVQAVLYMINTSKEEALDIWLHNSPRFRISPEIAAAIVDKYGYEKSLQKNVILSPKLTRDFLRKENIDLILKYLHLFSFQQEEAIMLLELHCVELTIQFLLRRMYINEALFDYISMYDEEEVFEAFFRCYAPSSTIRKKVLQNHSAKIFRIMVNYLHTPLTFEEVKLLFKYNDIDVFKAYLEHFYFDEEMTAYIVANASDAFFAEFIRQGAFPTNSAAPFERLFSPKNKGLLLEFLQNSTLNSGRWEIQLLESGDSELIEAYKQARVFSPEAVSYLIINKMNDEFGVTWRDIRYGDWRVETRIFTSGNNELIREYLFSEEAHLDELTDFGEAQLFLHASVEILCEYMKHKEPELLAQQALISRWELKLIYCFMYECHYLFTGEVASSFLEKAETNLALSYLQKLEETLFFSTEEAQECISVLCLRKEPKLYRFILDQLTLDDDAAVLFIRNASKEFVCEFIQKQEVSPKVEAEVLRCADKDIIKFYLKLRGINEENEYLLISLLDVELIDILDENKLTSDLASELLAL